MVCSICNNDTSNVDFDYLIGDDHLACHLGVWAGHKAMKQKPKNMKIKGWEKISGYTYKGLCIVNPIYNAYETKYMADVINLNLPQKPKWELSVLMPNFKFKQDSDITIILWDENKYRATKSVSKNIVSTITGFRILFEDLVDEVLKLQLISAATPISHSYQSGGASSNGIVNHINNTGTTIPYSQIVQSIQSMNQTIKNLTKK